MPAALRRATAGAMMRPSSLPSAPFSPACGLSPATARRGDAMPKRWRSASATVVAVATIRSSVSMPGTAASGTWMVTGTTATHLGPDHHHRVGVDAPPARCQLTEKFGMARMAEAGSVEHVLHDRRRHDGAGRARLDGRDALARSPRSPRARWRRRAGRLGPGLGCAAAPPAGLARRPPRRRPRRTRSSGTSSPAAVARAVKQTGIGEDEERLETLPVRATPSGRARGRCRPARPW